MKGRHLVHLLEMSTVQVERSDGPIAAANARLFSAPWRSSLCHFSLHPKAAIPLLEDAEKDRAEVSYAVKLSALTCHFAGVQ